MAELNGPRLEPRSGQAKRLVVFLHGYGADGNDLIEIGKAWQSLLPHAAFVSPNAPHPCGQAPMGREWFPLTFRSPTERWDGVNAAAPGLESFLDAELARHSLPPSALALVGFSQGTMMSLHVGLRKRPTTKEMGPLAERWRPYRAVAARLLWTYYRAVKMREGLIIAPKIPVKTPPKRLEKPKKKRAKNGR